MFFRFFLSSVPPQNPATSLPNPPATGKFPVFSVQPRIHA
jgi:hypothetical protein